MGQRFQFVAPRVELTLSWGGKPGEVLFDGSAGELVHLLAIPVGRKQYQSMLCLPRSDDADDQSQASPSPPSEQNEAQGPREESKPTARVTLLSLPTEIYWLIFSYIGDILDVISLGLTHQHFGPITHRCLEAYYSSSFGRWAGENIVCVGEDVLPDDFPPGLFSAEEAWGMRRTMLAVQDDETENSEENLVLVPWTLANFGFRGVSRPEEPYEDLRTKAISLYLKYKERRLDHDLVLDRLMHEWEVKEDTYFPTDERWVLRNLTTKQIVRSEAIAISPDYIHGPMIDGLGFGEVIMSRVCWSTSSTVSMVDPTNISKGVWAGHCFDIITLSRHESETRGEKWSDASDEIAREIASIWEANCGTDWREDIKKELE